MRHKVSSRTTASVGHHEISRPGTVSRFTGPETRSDRGRLLKLARIALYGPSRTAGADPDAVSDGIRAEEQKHARALLHYLQK
jgi:hypothetical protein